MLSILIIINIKFQFLTYYPCVFSCLPVTYILYLTFLILAMKLPEILSDVFPFFLRLDTRSSKLHPSPVHFHQSAQKAGRSSAHSLPFPPNIQAQLRSLSYTFSYYPAFFLWYPFIQKLNY